MSSCLKLLKSPLLARIKDASRRMQEVPFTARLDGCSLVGRIDLLLQEASGWVVVDYKTGSASDKERYRQQVGIYALAVQKCLGTTPGEVALVSLGDGDDYSLEVGSSLLDETQEMLCAVSGGIKEHRFEAARSEKCIQCVYRNRQC